MNVYIIDHSHTTIFCGGHGQDSPRFHHGYDVVWDIDKVVEEIFKYIIEQSEIVILDYSETKDHRTIYHDFVITHRNGTKTIININIYVSCKEMAQLKDNLQSLMNFDKKDFNKIVDAILERKDEIGYTVIDNRASIDLK